MPESNAANGSHTMTAEEPPSGTGSCLSGVEGWIPDWRRFQIGMETASTDLCVEFWLKGKQRKWGRGKCHSFADENKSFKIKNH